jgi:hypothetical protein
MQSIRSSVASRAKGIASVGSGRLAVALALTLVSGSLAGLASGSIVTDKKNGVENGVYFGADFVNGKGKTVLKAGYAWEKGTKPTTVTKYSVKPEFTAKQKADYDAEILKEFAKKGAIKSDGVLPTVAFDCHGLTMSDSKTWINDDQIDTPIIADQGWGIVAEKDAKVGDLVVYRKGGDVTHTGWVTAVDGKGKVSEVRSKWGQLGQYVHEPAVVPDSYGTPEYRTGGKALDVDPIKKADVEASATYKLAELFAVNVPELKPRFWDGTLYASITDATSFFHNDDPTPWIECAPGAAGAFSYALTIPGTGLFVEPGDSFVLYAEGVTFATVSGLASLGAYGGWTFTSNIDGKVTFSATTSATIEAGSLSFLEGFGIQSVYSQMGEILYTESAAGSVGVTCGPIPAPGAAALALVGGLLAGRRRRGT